MSGVQVRAANWPADREHVRHVRHSVFVVEQGVSEAHEWDGADDACWHVLAVDSTDQPVGTARLQPSGKIGRVAVLKPHRGTGVGISLIKSVLQIAEREGLQRIYLHAQETTVDFYRQFGFVVVGQPFVEAGITHRRMELMSARG